MHYRSGVLESIFRSKNTFQNTQFGMHKNYIID